MYQFVCKNERHKVFYACRKLTRDKIPFHLSCTSEKILQKKFQFTKNENKITQQPTDKIII